MNIHSVIFIIFMNIILWMNTLCIFWSSLSTKSILFIIFKCFFNVFFLNLVSIVINTSTESSTKRLPESVWVDLLTEAVLRRNWDNFLLCSWCWEWLQVGCLDLLFRDVWDSRESWLSPKLWSSILRWMAGVEFLWSMNRCLHRELLGVDGT